VAGVGGDVAAWEVDGVELFDGLCAFWLSRSVGGRESAEQQTATPEAVDTRAALAQLSMPTLARAVSAGHPGAALAMQRRAGNRATRALARAPVEGFTIDPTGAAQEAAKNVVPTPQEIGDFLVKKMSDSELGQYAKMVTTAARDAGDLSKSLVDTSAAIGKQLGALAATTAGAIDDAKNIRLDKLDPNQLKSLQNKGEAAVSEYTEAVGKIAGLADQFAANFLASKTGQAMLDQAAKAFPRTSRESLILLLRKGLSAQISGHAAKGFNTVKRVGQFTDDLSPSDRWALKNLYLALTTYQVPSYGSAFEYLAKKLTGNEKATAVNVSAGAFTGKVRTDDKGNIVLEGAVKGLRDTTVSAKAGEDPLSITIAGKEVKNVVAMQGNDLVVYQEALRQVGDASAKVRISAPNAAGGKSLDLELGNTYGNLLTASIKARFDAVKDKPDSKLKSLDLHAEAKDKHFNAKLDLEMGFTPAERSQLAAQFKFTDEKQLASFLVEYVRKWGGDQATLDEARVEMKIALKQLVMETNLKLGVSDGVATGSASARLGLDFGTFKIFGVAGMSTVNGGAAQGYGGIEVGTDTVMIGIQTPMAAGIGQTEGTRYTAEPAKGLMLTLTFVTDPNKKK